MIQTVASTSYERIAERYEHERGGKARATVIAEGLLPWLTPSAPAIDVGVGTGIIARTLMDQGVPVIGVDLSAGMLSQASVRLPGAAVLADAVALPVSTGSMGAAMFVWSLHHVGDPVAAFHEAGRVISSDGRVIVVSATPENVPDDVQELFRRLDVLSPPRATDWIVQNATSAELRLVAATHLEIGVSRSPLDLVKQIEDRLYSPLWDLDTERWDSIVVPILTDLRDPDDPYRKRSSTLLSPLLVFES